MTRTGLALLGVLGTLVFAPLGPAWAQGAPGAEPSMTCRLFPLACPGPVPAPPPPLLGTPEEQAAAAEPAPAPKPAKHHRAHKHAAKAAQ